MKCMSNKRGKSTAQAEVSVLNRTFNVTQLAPFYDPGLNYEQEYILKVQNNPTILAADATDYKDSQYVRSVCELFWVIAKSSEFPIAQLKKFRISNMEKAFTKLAKEQRDEYKELCKCWGIVPEEHRSKKSTTGVQPYRHLNRLIHWGYFELYFPNMDDVVGLVTKKCLVSGNNMSKLDIAKYAQILTLFIAGQSLMPYDIDEFTDAYNRFETQGIVVDKYDLKETVLATIMSNEKKCCWGAGMLYHFYNMYMKELPDASINIEAVEYFLDLIDYKHKLIIKEFMDMLSDEMFNGVSEKSDFKSMYLTSIMVNLDIRALKEQIFPLGIWESTTRLFMTTLSDKEKLAYHYAYNRFKDNGFCLGKGVETVQEPYSARHPFNQTEYLMYGYHYAWSPLEVCVSDPNELWMMRIV